MSWLHGRTYWGWVRLRDGHRFRCSLGVGDRATAKEAERMLDLLHARRDWPLLEAAVFGPSSVGELFDYWRRGEDALDELRARLGDVDLAQYVEPWVPWAERRANPATVAKYRKQLGALLPAGKPFLRSAFTRRYISEALAALRCSGSTARRYLAAWSSFAGFLVDREVLDTNPVRSVKAPRGNPPRELWFPLEQVKRLVDAQSEPFRALAALREGAGVEISAALAVHRGDVDVTNATVHVRGTKSAARTRTVHVEAWAVAHLAEYLRGVPSTPTAPLFEGVTARRALDVQRRALERLGLDVRYTLHDARHSYAVRQVKAGAPLQEIARNLGHKDAVMVLRIYGKYQPVAGDFARARLRVAG